MAMFGQEIPKTKLIIVHSKTTAAFANYLQMLISSKKEQGDNDTGSADRVVETTIWSDEEYMDAEELAKEIHDARCYNPKRDEFLEKYFTEP